MTTVVPENRCDDDSERPVLSLIIASRNDRYMGDSLWRLQTTLNYTAMNVHSLGLENDVEIVVTDWGSETRLCDVLRLSPQAAQIVSFIHVSPALAWEKQGDSPFPEVLAINAAVRRVKGQYIGRIDNDTLVGRRFLELFFELAEGNQTLDTPLESALILTNRHQIPYRFAARCPPFWQVDWFIQKYGERLLVQSGVTFGKPFFQGATGVWLLHRDLWTECGGYDENLLYWGWMESDMVYRLTQKYTLIDWDLKHGCDFYHLEHYDPRAQRKTMRKGNIIKTDNSFRPNGDDWGLIQYHLDVVPYPHEHDNGKEAELTPPPLAWLTFILTMLSVKMQQFIDIPYILARRIILAKHTLQQQPIGTWPTLLMRWMKMWITKRA